MSLRPLVPRRVAGAAPFLFGAFVTPLVRSVAQESSGRPQPEIRVDFIGSRAEAAHLGVGIAFPAGTYVRLAIVGGLGQAWAEDGSRLAGRLDGLARFVADPLRESRWALYAGAGAGGLFDERDRWKAVLIGALGLEGPARGGVAPAVEVGFGGGVRAGIALRRAFRDRR